MPPNHHCNKLSLPIIRASFPSQQSNVIISNQRKLVTTFLVTSLASSTRVARHRSSSRELGGEQFFEPGLSPDDAAARIKQTAEGFHSIRDMLENMSWRYVMFYIRLKQLIFLGI
ncbi:photosynthetic NDH subunit of lumenal location 2, chloroplastic-like [Durio zibethinus]|uniref:Photosynthetic NDH subunit of lumenal location 2, chloroplastic-like n=1 Tax=Durio zibethinus TaxID=66656 RepID=A0A6P5XXY2_DURZI|nr:photosynthetic NDH subunit of lumenal location 2, chloroplastic-like [Durio zibethinus]